MIIFIALALMQSSYIGWNYNNPELAVAGTILHGFEFIYVRLACTGCVFGFDGGDYIHI